MEHTMKHSHYFNSPQGILFCKIKPAKSHKRLTPWCSTHLHSVTSRSWLKMWRECVNTQRNINLYLPTLLPLYDPQIDRIHLVCLNSKLKIKHFEIDIHNVCKSVKLSSCSNKEPSLPGRPSKSSRGRKKWCRNTVCSVEARGEVHETRSKYQWKRRSCRLSEILRHICLLLGICFIRFHFSSKLSGGFEWVQWRRDAHQAGWAALARPCHCVLLPGTTTHIPSWNWKTKYLTGNTAQK